jgi:hypothetical protein
VLITGTVFPALGCKLAAKKSVESGGPIVMGVNPINGVDGLPFMKLVAVTVAKPVKLEVPGHVPRAAAGPPLNVIQFASAVAVHIAMTSAGTKSIRILSMVVISWLG